MSLTVLKPGMQTTIQGEPRRGVRHLGIPAAGPADPLSLALANRLLGNALLASGLEVTLSGVTLGIASHTAVAVTGADVVVSVNGAARSMHSTIELRPGDELATGGATAGARSYIAVLGGLSGANVLGSGSTYLPAEIGGFNGRALEPGDELACEDRKLPGDAVTPEEFRLLPGSGVGLRACALIRESSDQLFDQTWRVGQRADRMGLELLGERMEGVDSGRLPSVPVFPGCVQCPPDGTPFLLSVDAQTTGGYARMAQVIRADRHAIGQLRPGDSLSFLRRTPDQAIAELCGKVEYWSAWLPDCEAIFI